ncbi:hypothetical protein ACHAXT_012729 [Thalassiosira profunda]
MDRSKMTQIELPSIEPMDDDDPAPPLIRPIAPSAVRRIAAGQAVTDLSSAVKELVDNAIDAGAKRVTVKLHDQGLEAIEVSDDGTGVPPSSRAWMATKHATSKLRSFDELYGGRRREEEEDDEGGENDGGGAGGVGSHPSAPSCAPTLGFRGEALFCLANLSRSLVVTTRSACSAGTDNSGGLGEQFSFDKEGALIEGSVKKVPRAVGTTVTVRGLFEAVPVRRVDLVKRIKGQRQKLMRMMQGYAILCLGTQFNVTDVPSQTGGKKARGRGKTEVRLATSEASRSLEARTANVLGTKFLSGLARIEVDLSEAVAPSSGDNRTNGSGAAKGRWKLTGLVSHAPASPAPGAARDLQFFGVNGRPVDLPSVARVLGDAWRLFDPAAADAKGGGAGRKRPACVWAFELPEGAYDVNLSPDKREVLFADEAAVAEAIREGLTQLWEGQCGGRFAANEVEGRSRGKTAGAKEAAREKKDDGDTVTPKLTRKDGGAVPGAEDGPVVTPMDAAGRSNVSPVPGVSATASGQSPRVENGTDREKEGGGRDDALPSVTQEMSQQSSKKAKRAASLQTQGEAETAVPQHNDDGAMPPQRGWEQRRLPERARQQDRRGWEQMRINFQRVERAQLRQEMERVLPPDEGGSDDDGPDEGEGPVIGTSAAWRQRTARRRSTSRSSAANSEPRAAAEASSAEARPAKRQTRPKRDIASVLDGFSYGSAKPAAAQENPESKSGSDGEESDNVDMTDVAGGPARSSRREAGAAASRNERNARMLVGATVSSERKRPRAASSRESIEASNPPPSRRRRSTSLDSSMDEEERNENETDTGSESGSPPVEAVWNNFSGTRDVIEQYRNARRTMRKNRKQLLSSMKRKRKDGANGDKTGDSTAEDAAENDEPTINLKQEDFQHMSIIGQFNLGFILARCRNNSLWILDQHACDEKYNFERLCRETVIHEQKLIAPLPLELSPSEEHTVLENMDVFERNGFRFAYDPEREPRHRLSLTALPHSGSGGDGKKAVQFGKEDVGALCAMLGADGVSSSEGYTAGFDAGADGGRIAGVNAVRRYAGLAGGGLSRDGAKSSGIVGPSIVRLPKAIGMFASRACRSSIMIGTALSDKEQANVLAKLEKTEVPWNCAHGRPTMSHVRSLAKTLIEDEEAIAAHVAGPTLSVDSEV